MARRKRQTTAQSIVGLATTGMPEPVRSILSSRLGSLLILLGIPILVGLGIIHISWTGGRPQITIDKQRAQQVRQELRHEVETRTAHALDDWRQKQ